MMIPAETVQSRTHESTVKFFCITHILTQQESNALKDLMESQPTLLIRLGRRRLQSQDALREE